MMKIKLTQGQFALVDDRDYCYLSQWKWYAYLKKDIGSYYASTRINGKNVSMHRIILNAPKHLIVDHDNHDTLDNQRSNIKLVNHSINNKNRRMQSNNTSGFNGVYRNKKNGFWYSQIRINRKTIYLGEFIEKSDAIQCRINADVKYNFNKNHGVLLTN